MKKTFLFLALTLVLAVGLSAFTFDGTWDLYYDWGCNNTYSSAAITFTGSNAGTFTCGTFSGTWYEEDGCKIIFQFDNGTTYAGTKVGRCMQGMMTTTATSNGCFYAIKRNDPYTTSADMYPKNVAGESSGISDTKTK